MWVKNHRARKGVALALIAMAALGLVPFAAETGHFVQNQHARQLMVNGDDDAVAYKRVVTSGTQLIPRHGLRARAESPRLHRCVISHSRGADGSTIAAGGES